MSCAAYDPVLDLGRTTYVYMQFTNIPSGSNEPPKIVTASIEARKTVRTNLHQVRRHSGSQMPNHYYYMHALDFYVE